MTMRMNEQTTNDGFIIAIPMMAGIRAFGR